MLRKTKRQTNQVFGYPVVGRYGLAHSLLAWARCEIWCASQNVPMIAPSWRYLKIGPFLRGERDKRQYHRLFRFPRYVRGLRRHWLLKTLPHHQAEAPGVHNDSLERGVMVFNNAVSRNEETFFPDILAHHQHIRHALTEMTKPEYRPESIGYPHIAVHVRMGDFSQSTIAQLKAGSKNSCIPIQWYASMVQGLHRVLEFAVPTILYSDGSDESLQPLLCLPNVIRSARQQSIGDLLSMAQASLLVSSGSGFSHWGSFLGQVPRICFPGQRFCNALLSQNDLELEPECEVIDEIPNSTIAYLKRQVSA